MSVEWYYTTNKEQMGPVSWEELRELADAGILKPSDMVWNDGMEEWDKASNQAGLFADEEIRKTKKKSRSRDDDDDEDEDSERERKRKRRKREQERAQSGVGLKVFGILAGVVGLFLCCGCGGVGIAVLSLGGFPFGQAPAPQNYVITNLRVTPNGADPHVGDVRTFKIEQGKRVVIQVQNNLQFPNTDVDLYVYQAGNNNPLVMDIRTPNFDRNCRVQFVAPQTGSYRVRVVNIGPGTAHTCNVMFTVN